MNRKILRGAAIALAALVLPAFAVYLGLAQYYQDCFSCGTFINGVYCTGKTVEEVNEELLKGCSYEGLTVYDRTGAAFRIEAQTAGCSFDFTQALSGCFKKQNPWLWIGRLFVPDRRTLAPEISCDPQKLERVLASFSLFTQELLTEERKVCVIKTLKGYELVNEREGVLDQEAAKKAIRKAFSGFATELDLVKEGCYTDLPLTEEMEAELRLWERLQEFQDCRVIYRFGEEQVAVDSSVTCDWIALDKEGNFLYGEDGRLLADEERIGAFVERLADEFDTVGSVRYFKATRGETVSVEGGTYGNRMDREAEKEYLTQAFKDRESGIHTPKYLQRALCQGHDDIGSTYIEVDMKEQMLYYYENGVKRLETAIVTGNTGRRMGTPEGVNYVCAKQENRVLRGPDYASHVNFWMPVKGNIGIHDAAWRSEFGGDIYKTAGSHGCINTPCDAMSELYGMVKTGTPVVMFYG